MDAVQTRQSGVRWRSVALPTEHGGWSFVSEPLLLGLVLAPSWGGLTISLATLGAFLLRHPLKIYAKDALNQRTVPRTAVARRFMLLYAGIMAVMGVLTLALIPSANALLPVLFSVPLFALQLSFDFRNQSRSAIAEMAGAVATGALSASIVMMQGWSLGAALGLWLAVAVKAISTILYVRSRLRLEREQPAGVRLTVTAQGVGVLVLVASRVSGLTPWTAALAMLILAGRATVGLSPYRKPRPPKIIGIQEILFGLVFVVTVALGYRAG